MSFRVETRLATRDLRRDLETESRRIVSAGGQPIPPRVIDECVDLLACFRFTPVDLQREVLKRVQPYRLTEPKLWAEHCAKLKIVALQSSRLTRLRQRRGLPFKSRRQP